MFFVTILFVETHYVIKVFRKAKYKQSLHMLLLSPKWGFQRGVERSEVTPLASFLAPPFFLRRERMVEN